MDFRLEICVDSVESAVKAQVGGAHRVELCDNLMEGGTTPSFGTIASARENLSIALHVIIRPRGGDFLYTAQEFDIMKRDIEICGEYGVNGVVIGILHKDGSIDIERTAQLIGFARPMAVTFHRAFDVCNDPVKGLSDIIASGADSILTSGQKDNVMAGAGLVSRLVKEAGDRIIIMPGCGLDETNIAEAAKITGANEFHLTGRSRVESHMTFRRGGIPMGGSPDIPEFSRLVADPDKIKKIVDVLKMI